MGAVHYCPVPFWPHNTTLYVTDFRGNVRRFVYFAFKTINFRTFDSGSVQASLNRNNLYSMPLWRPPLQEQHAIASLLGALDDKIELNRRRNETLEELARTIFKSWFVEFDPVRAKAEGRQPVGMDAETAALFPSGLVESELGEIPEGWRTGTLGTVSTYLRRGFGPGYAETGGVCVLNQKCIRDGRLDLGKARRHDVSKKPVEGRQLQLGDLLVNSTGVGTLGRVAQVWRLPELTIVDSHVTVVRADPNILSPIVLGVDLGRREAEVEALGEGSTGQTELSRERLAQLSVLMASRGVQQRFATLVEPMRQRMIVSEEESASLAGLRDLLLPKLISGDLRIPLAEKMAQAVL
jgi:type I restriction enzyme S subunit